MKDIDVMANALAERKLLLVIGSGLSEKVYPTWDNLIEPFKKQLADKSERYKDEKDPSVIAELYLKEFHEKRKDFKKNIATEFKKITPRIKSIHNTLLSIEFIQFYITTNWDPLLEIAADKLNRPCDLVYKDREIINISEESDKCKILKIHGDINDPESIILTLNDFVEYKKTHKFITEHLNILFQDHHILFVGTGLIRDANLLSFYNDLWKELGRRKRPTYIIFDQKDYNNKIPDINKLEASQINIVRIKNYDYLDRWFSDLYVEAKKIRKSKDNLIEIDKYKRERLLPEIEEEIKGLKTNLEKKINLKFETIKKDIKTWDNKNAKSVLMEFGNETYNDKDKILYKELIAQILIYVSKILFTFEYDNESIEFLKKAKEFEEFKKEGIKRLEASYKIGASKPNFREAIRILEDAKEKESLRLKFLCYLYLNELSKCKEMLTSDILPDDLNDLSIMSAKAAYYTNIGEVDKGIDYISKCIDNNNDPYYMFQAGDIYRQKGFQKINNFIQKFNLVDSSALLEPLIINFMIDKDYVNKSFEVYTKALLTADKFGLKNLKNIILESIPNITYCEYLQKEFLDILLKIECPDKFNLFKLSLQYFYTKLSQNEKDKLKYKIFVLIDKLKTIENAENDYTIWNTIIDTYMSFNEYSNAVKYLESIFTIRRYLKSLNYIYLMI